jgi:hypothetical protein
MGRATFTGLVLGLASLQEASQPLAVAAIGIDLGDDQSLGVVLVTCPHCSRMALRPALARRGKILMAECDRCDMYFDL